MSVLAEGAALPPRRIVLAVLATVPTATGFR
jgi:hypothetical protein